MSQHKESTVSALLDTAALRHGIHHKLQE